MQNQFAKYDGPDYCVIKAIDEFEWSVTTNNGERIGTYSNCEKAQSVAKKVEAKMLDNYMRAKK